MKLREFARNIRRDIQNLPPRITRDFIKNTQLTKFPRGTMLLTEREMCNFIGLVKTGLSRKFHFRKNREVTTEFFFSNDFITSFHSYHLELESRERYQYLEQVHPRFLQQIPLRHLASYLGITIETLSKDTELQDRNPSESRKSVSAVPATFWRDGKRWRTCSL